MSTSEKRRASVTPSAPPPDVAALWVPLDALVPWAKNPKRHEPAEVAELATSIRELGFGAPLIARTANRELMAGHGRHLACTLLVKQWAAATADERERWSDDARRIGERREAPTRFMDVSARRAHLYALADNRHAEKSQYDPTLRAEVASDFSFDELAIAGWSQADVAAWGDEALPDFGEPTEAPEEPATGDDEPEESDDVEHEPPAEPRTKLGDVYRLGRHLLVCGASGSPTVEPWIPRDRVLTLCTDPPYCSGGFQEANRAAGSVGTDRAHKKIANDRLSTRGFQALIRAVLDQVRPRDAYMFTDWKQWGPLYDVAESSGLMVRSMIVWAKPTPGMGMGWRAQHELILYAAREVPKFTKNVGNVISEKRQRNELHTTQKPIEVMARLIEMCPGDGVIVDTFAGSGTTLLACEKAGRDCFAVELEPGYCDVIVDRWEALTGGTAELLHRVER